MMILNQSVHFWLLLVILFVNLWFTVSQPIREAGSIQSKSENGATNKVKDYNYQAILQGINELTNSLDQKGSDEVRYVLNSKKERNNSKTRSAKRDWGSDGELRVWG